MHCDMLKIQDGGAIVEKVNYIVVHHEKLPKTFTRTSTQGLKIIEEKGLP